MFVGGHRVIVAAACALAAAVGCSSSGSIGRTLPPLTVSTTPTPTVATSSPSHEDALTAATRVVREYFRVVNDLHRKMDAQALAKLMTPSCKCQEQVRAVSAAALKGEHYVDQARRITLTPALDDDRHVEVLAQFDAAAGGIVDRRGRHLTASPPRKKLRRVFQLTASQGTWLISDIEAV